FCNPHNPIGRVYTRKELETLADICLRHGLIICSDEIHCDLVYPPHRHIPIATLSSEVESRTVTLMAPSKTYNIAGLEFGYAVIRNNVLMNRWREVSYGIVPGINIMGHVAALAAMSEGQEWLDQATAYLRENRDFLLDFIRGGMPSVNVSDIEATYLAWLDCNKTGIAGKPSDFFLKRAKVALTDGEDFGTGGKHFVRLNFACRRALLVQALNRMKEAMKEL
ncbi:MAG TPA: aminotransferase class I/II-fold pyridoxal phosphate-dependent enzyme, partial [Acidobacteriota bacterium]|nr:aminotransferase class I/II-fold pyridoxal phosphate-dependent enzyme [Acidobacteriota bacterium]